MTTRRANVYLIGPMGSGKTAVGKRLAAMLDKQFLDSDAEIERRCGVDIPYIFEKEGEARFRERERDVIAALTAARRRRRRDRRRRRARSRRIASGSRPRARSSISRRPSTRS